MKHFVYAILVLWVLVGFVGDWATAQPTKQNPTAVQSGTTAQDSVVLVFYIEYELRQPETTSTSNKQSLAATSYPVAYTKQPTNNTNVWQRITHFFFSLLENILFSSLNL